MTEERRERTAGRGRVVFMSKHDANTAWNELQELLSEDPETVDTPTGDKLRAKPPDPLECT